MIEAYEVETVRVAERELVETLVEAGDDPLVLMKRAAKGIAAVALERIDEIGATSVVALVGPGDNGGDALLAAARLARKDVPVLAVLAVEAVHRTARKTAEKAGVVLVDAVTHPVRAIERVEDADLVLDGLLGMGGRPGLSGVMADLARAVDPEAYVLAIDLPSGLDPAGESPASAFVRADETLAMGVLKPVHLLPATQGHLGQVGVVDIGLQMAVPPAVQSLTFDDAAARWPVPGEHDDKYRRGVLGVVAGSEQYPGAAVLVTSAAVEAGAGMVRYVGPRRAEDLVLGRSPEVVPGAGRVQAWVIGPGLGTADDLDDAQRDAAREALGSDLPVLLDAGGIGLLEAPRAAATLLTPHAGELATLLSRLEGAEVTRAQVEADAVDHARRAAALTGATVLLKGSSTLVVGPDAACVRVQREAPAWLATAGAGDTLAGIVGVLLAAGVEPADAGAVAALVHGLAAERANPGGPVRALAVGASVPGAVAELLRR